MSTNVDDRFVYGTVSHIDPTDVEANFDPEKCLIELRRVDNFVTVGSGMPNRDGFYEIKVPKDVEVYVICFAPGYRPLVSNETAFGVERIVFSMS